MLLSMTFIMKVHSASNVSTNLKPAVACIAQELDDRLPIASTPALSSVRKTREHFQLKASLCGKIIVG